MEGNSARRNGRFRAKPEAHLNILSPPEKRRGGAFARSQADDHVTACAILPTLERGQRSGCQNPDLRP